MEVVKNLGDICLNSAWNKILGLAQIHTEKRYLNHWIYKRFSTRNRIFSCLSRLIITSDKEYLHARIKSRHILGKYDICILSGRPPYNSSSPTPATWSGRGQRRQADTCSLGNSNSCSDLTLRAMVSKASSETSTTPIEFLPGYLLVWNQLPWFHLYRQAWGFFGKLSSGCEKSWFPAQWVSSNLSFVSENGMVAWPESGPKEKKW